MIGKMYKNHADLIACVSLYIFSLVFLLVMALRLSIPPVIDEVATIASPMYLTGNDWTEALHAMGGYYFKYGGGMIYYPLVLFIKDPYILYRSMLTLNAVVCSFIPVIAFIILKKHFGVRRSASYVMSLITFALPYTALYTLYARADAMLIFTPWLIVLLILELVKNSVSGASGEDKRRAARKRVMLSALLAFLSCLSYSFHTRGIVVILAVIFAVTLISLILRTGIVAVIPGGISLGVCLFADRMIASYFTEALYSKYGTSFSSAEAYDFGALTKIFTADGFKGFVYETLGAMFNSLVSTWGLAGIGVLLGSFLVIRFIRKRSEASNAVMAFTAFAVILFLGSFAMSVIYFFPYVNELLASSEPTRSDWLVYGRYAACGSGPCILAALYLCFNKKEKIYSILKVLSLVIFAAVCALFLIYVAPHIEGVSAVMRNFISICGFVSLKSEGITTAVIPGVTTSFMMSAVLAGIVMLIIVILSMTVKKSVALYSAALFLSVISVIITFVDYDKIRLSRNEKLDSWITPVTDIISADPEMKDMKVFVDPSAKDIKHYQFVLAGHVCFGEGTAEFPEEPFLVIASKKTGIENLKLPKRQDGSGYTLTEIIDVEEYGSARDKVYMCYVTGRS
ncbi:MAG: hypothetical protein K6E95_00085 [Lachnospiraceae bacterium]|nr:hypothetical protein [Lachnospiraceae bacterium]